MSAPAATIRASTCTVTLHVPAGQLTDEINLSNGLILTIPAPTTDPLTPGTPGARLLDSEPVQIRLGPTSARFPVETLSFSSIHRPGAPWAVSIIADGPSDPFMGAVRLLLNADHDAVQTLDQGERNEQKLIQSALRVDTIRQLFNFAVQDPRFSEEAGSFPDGSLGAALEAIARNTLGTTMTAILELLRHQPTRFDATLQARLGYLGGVA